MKKLLLTLTLIFMLISICSCTSVKKTNYLKIEDGMFYDDVIRILGEPNEKKPNMPDMYHNCYYWYDNAGTLDEAKKLVKEGKKVYYIGIMTTTTKYIVIGKSAGYVTENLKYGEISVNV